MSVKSVLINALVAGSLVAASAPAFAYSDAEMACAGDAMRFCSKEIYNYSGKERDQKVGACLARNKAQLSASCKANFK